MFLKTLAERHRESMLYIHHICKNILQFYFLFKYTILKLRIAHWHRSTAISYKLFVYSRGTSEALRPRDQVQPHGWTRQPLKVPCNPNHSMVLRGCQKLDPISQGRPWRAPMKPWYSGARAGVLISPFNKNLHLDIRTSREDF